MTSITVIRTVFIWVDFFPTPTRLRCLYLHNNMIFYYKMLFSLNMLYYYIIIVRGMQFVRIRDVVVPIL